MIVIILLFGLVLRLLNINQSLWLDEAINAQAVLNYSYHDLITNYSIGDFHPPLFHILTKATTSIFGISEIALRMPSAVLGTGIIFATYLIGKELFDKKTGAIAAILTASAPLAIYYSQEARMYTLAAFFASWSVYFFLKVLKSEKIINWLGFITSTALVLYSDYLPYFLIPTYVLFLLFYRKNLPKAKLSAFVPAFILILIFILPWLLIFPKQLTTGLAAAYSSPAWSKVVGAPSIKAVFLVPVKFTIGRISLDNNSIYLALLSLLFAIEALISIFAIFRFSKLRAFVLFWLFVPTVAAFVLSFRIPIFSYFRFIFVLPAFYLLLALGINTLNWPKLNRAFLAIFLAINLTCAFVYIFNPKFHRENWKGATAYIQENRDKKTVVLFENPTTLSPFDYYSKGQIEAKGALDKFNPTEEGTRAKIAEATENKNKVYLFQYLVEISDPQELAFRKLSEEGFTNVATTNFAGIGFLYEFKRK